MTRPSSNPGYFYYDHDIPYEWRIRTITFYTSHQYIRRGDDFVRIDVPDDMKVSTFADQLLFAPRYSPANVTMAAGEEAEEFATAILKMAWSHNRHACAEDVLLMNHGEKYTYFFLFEKNKIKREHCLPLWRWLYGCPCRSCHVCKCRTAWTYNGKEYPGGALLAAKADDFFAGGAQLMELFVPTSRSSLEDWTATRTLLILTVLDNVKSRCVGQGSFYCALPPVFTCWLL
jgi:prolyl oligopeptidase PreP (S9A serine peptidase family)